jgi:hypothetical protein
VGNLNSGKSPNTAPFAASTRPLRTQLSTTYPPPTPCKINSILAGIIQFRVKNIPWSVRNRFHRASRHNTKGNWTHETMLSELNTYETRPCRPCLHAPRFFHSTLGPFWWPHTLYLSLPFSLSSTLSLSFEVPSKETRLSSEELFEANKFAQRLCRKRKFSEVAGASDVEVYLAP